LIVLFLGAYLAFNDIQSFPKSAETAVLVAVAPGTVYAQPAALLSATQQLQTVVELLGHFPNLKPQTQPGFNCKKQTADQLAATVRQFLRREAYRVAAFGRTAIISPFHHFF
jgi:hypothetical protein